MKKIVFVLLFVAIACSVKAEDKPKSVKSKLKSATVFLSGAQLTHTAEVQISSGSNTIIFEDLTANINTQSIQVKGEGNFSILSVSHQLNYLRPQEETAEIKRLQDSVTLLQSDLDYQNAMLSVYQDEESMVLANKNLGGNNTGVKAQDIKDAADFYRARLTDIRNAKLGITVKIKKLNDLITKLNSQLKTLNASKTKATGEIVVITDAAAPVTAKFTIQYLVTNAGWIPSYDMRATDVNNPMELVYKANIWQNTGKEWNNVKLTLSTGNPTRSGSRPELSTWYLSFLPDYTYNKYKTPGVAGGVNQAPSAAREATGADGDYDKKDESRTGADYTTVSENQTNIQYDISVPYTIPGDGKYKIVEIQKNTLPAQYEYYAAPKLDPDAFLMAKVSGWEQYNLLPGEMNLFFEGTYLGKSNINPQYTKDTLEISLGRDKGISITREKLQDLSSTKLIGTNTKVTYAYEISIRNKKKLALNITIADQLPVTTDKDIVIEQIELSGAAVDEPTGRISWKFELKPSETKSLKFSYSVKYPKDKRINL